MNQLVAMIVNQKDSGVSPVVGVILMVAVTVILAAVIGSFVLDLGSSVSQSAQAGVSFDESVGTSSVDIQLTTVQAADSIWVTSSSSSGTFTGGVTGEYNSDEEIGNTSTGDGSQYLLLRGGDDGPHGGPGTIVTYEGSEGDQLSVLGEVEGESSVIQTYTLGS